MTLTRRSFLHASLMAGGLVAVPQFGRWFRPPERRVVGPVYEVWIDGRRREVGAPDGGVGCEWPPMWPNGAGLVQGGCPAAHYPDARWGAPGVPLPPIRTTAMRLTVTADTKKAEDMLTALVQQQLPAQRFIDARFQLLPRERAQKSGPRNGYVTVHLRPAFGT